MGLQKCDPIFLCSSLLTGTDERWYNPILTKETGIVIATGKARFSITGEFATLLPGPPCNIVLDRSYTRQTK